jgi:hypothetical protein
MEGKATMSTTPGPWEWHYHPDPDLPDRPIALVSNDGDVLLCTGDESRAWGHAKSEADLRLIEASPALLLVCQAMVEMFDLLDRHFEVPGWTLSDREKVGQARALLVSLEAIP